MQQGLCRQSVNELVSCLDWLSVALRAHVHLLRNLGKAQVPFWWVQEELRSHFYKGPLDTERPAAMSESLSLQTLLLNLQNSKSTCRADWQGWDAGCGAEHPGYCPSLTLCSPTPCLQERAHSLASLKSGNKYHCTTH